MPLKSSRVGGRSNLGTLSTKRTLLVEVSIFAGLAGAGFSSAAIAGVREPADKTANQTMNRDTAGKAMRIFHGRLVRMMMRRHFALRPSQRKKVSAARRRNR